MKEYSLSRSSKLYKFIFGQHGEWQLEGFPEPQNDRITVGVFVGLFILMALLRPLGFALMLFFEALMRIISFAVDGSYSRGRFPDTIKLVKMEPWPKFFGRRLSPWLVFSVGFAAYQYFTTGLVSAVVCLILFGIMTAIFLSIRPGDASPSMMLVEEIGPKVDEKIHLTYYREPKLFPAIRLIK